MQYLIDASVYVFRAYYSMPDDMVDHDGNPVNALYGFCRFLGDFVERVKPDHIAVCFDESLATSFRNDIYPLYKANREPAPEDLERQFHQCRRYTRSMGIMEMASPVYEADDLIGTLVEHGRRLGRPSTIVSRDKDLAQLLGRQDVFWDFSGRGKIYYDQVAEVFGVRPEQIADFLALAGDAVDNIPGVLGGKLEQHTEAAMIARKLTGIACDAPMDNPEPLLKPSTPRLGEVNALFDEANIGTALRRQAERVADIMSDVPF